MSNMSRTKLSLCLWMYRLIARLKYTQRLMTPPLHRDEMRFHTTAGTTQVLVS